MGIQEQMVKELEEKEIFNQAKTYAFEYIDKIEQQDVYPNERNLQKLRSLDESLSEESTSPDEILSLLNDVGSLGTVTHTGVSIL